LPFKALTKVSGPSGIEQWQAMGEDLENNSIIIVYLILFTATSNTCSSNVKST